MGRPSQIHRIFQRTLARSRVATENLMLPVGTKEIMTTVASVSMTRIFRIIFHVVLVPLPDKNYVFDAAPGRTAWMLFGNQVRYIHAVLALVAALTGCTASPENYHSRSLEAPPA